MNKAMAFIKRYVSGVRDTEHGEKYGTILKYVFPELVTALILSSLLDCINTFFIAHLCSTALLVAQGLSSVLIYFITKSLEGLSIGTVIMCGFYNGRNDYKEAGRAFASAFWMAVLIGGAVALSLCLGATAIYSLYGVSSQIVASGAEYLRVRALGIFFSCIFFVIVGFLRATKNTRVPMFFLMFGAGVFLIFDYLLIFGKGGFSAMYFLGSAYASVIQYGVMAVGIMLYVLLDPAMRKYEINLFSGFRMRFSLRLIRLSIPVACEKASQAFSKNWLFYLIAPLGNVALASYTVIKEMEQFALVPAMACGQVITLLVSNNYGIGDWLGIKNNIKKILLLAAGFVFTILIIFLCAPNFFIGLFDKKHVFTPFAVTAFALISIFVIFDILQLILAAALRGAGKVYVVMAVRLGTFAMFFVPVSWSVSLFPIANPVLKFVSIYSVFYISGALMGCIYWWYLSRAERQYVTGKKKLAD